MNIENVKGVLEVLDGDTRYAMHSILGFLELIAEGELDQKQRDFVEACRAAADRQCRGIEDARLVLGLISGERQAIADFDPQDLFSGFAEVVGTMAQRKGVGLASKVANGVPSLVSGDADRIGHALLRVAAGVVSSLDGSDLNLNLGALASPGGFNLSFEILAAVGWSTTRLPSNWMLSPYSTLSHNSLRFALVRWRARRAAQGASIMVRAS